MLTLNTLYKLCFRILALFLLSFTINHAYAEDFSEEIFQVEYILFTHQGHVEANRKFNLVPYNPPRHSQYTHLIEGLETLSNFQYEQLDSSSMQLNDALSKLNKSRDVRVIKYGAWQQAIEPDSTLPPLRISALTDVVQNESYYGETHLEGTLTIKRSRYMHIEADLFLTSFLFYPERNIFDWLLSTSTIRHKTDSLLQAYKPDEIVLSKHSSSRIPSQVFRLHQSRRLKYGEIHYLDHPAIGLIVTINKLEPEPEI